MAFPDIPTVAGGRVVTGVNTAGGATKTFPDLAGLTKNSGDLLIAICLEYNGNSTNAEFSAWGASFIEFADFASVGQVAMGAAYKFSTGSETGTFTVTTADTGTTDSVFFLLSIAGAHASTPPAAGSQAFGNNATPSGLLDPADWGTEDTLWITVAGVGETSTGGAFSGVTAAPTNYTGFVETGISADVVGGMDGGIGFRQLNAASEVSGGFSFDSTNTRNMAAMIAVRPAPAIYQPRHPAHDFGSVTPY